MAVPKFYAFLLPVLRSLADGAPQHWRDVREQCVTELGVTDEDRRETIARGTPKVDSRVLWANTYLFQAGLVDRPKRGAVQLNAQGRAVLDDPPAVIDPAYLRQFSSFRDFEGRTRKINTSETEPADEATPLETIAAAVSESSEALRAELLKRVLAQPPEFFEHLVLDLLTAMGYGGQAGAVEHRGRTGDAGIDGVIRQDPLGIDRVYLQAKRYTDNSVGRPDMQAFVGALHGVQADRGVFITTSTFSQAAREYVERIPNRIILIDGARLVELMDLYDVGVQAKQRFTLKEIDEDFFDRE